MYGDEALKLVREAKRCGDTMLPTYNETVVRNVVKEVRLLNDELQRLLGVADENAGDPSLGLQASFVIHHASIQRNKRCLLAYHHARMRNIKALVWDLGAGAHTAELKRRLSPAESALAQDYADLVTNYKATYTDLDLGTSCDAPPKDLFVCVRVLKDCGEIMSERGSILLKKNSQHFLRRTDADLLITQGLLKHVD
ncbi:DNA replication protein psf1 [Sorochytrium milnesiophthora]